MVVAEIEKAELSVEEGVWNEILDVVHTQDKTITPDFRVIVKNVSPDAISLSIGLYDTQDDEWDLFLSGFPIEPDATTVITIPAEYLYRALNVNHEYTFYAGEGPDIAEYGTLTFTIQKEPFDTHKLLIGAAVVGVGATIIYILKRKGRI